MLKVRSRGRVNARVARCRQSLPGPHISENAGGGGDKELKHNTVSFTGEERAARERKQQLIAPC